MAKTVKLEGCELHDLFCSCFMIKITALAYLYEVLRFTSRRTWFH